MTFFSESSPLGRALAARNYASATPVQAAVLAPEVGERDLLVSAQTGSGKTVAYGLAIASTLMGEEPRLGWAGAPLALIVAPTRELALQVQRELEWLYEQAGARIVSCVGGMDPKAERRRLAGGVHIVVGTPGRLRDHIERGGLDVSGLRAVVLDEADEMLDLGFREDLEFILSTTPPERRTLLFSATMPRAIEVLARNYQRGAMRIEVGRDELGHADIDYRAMRIVPHEIEHAVVNTLRFFDAQTSIIFCNTRNAVRHLQAVLLERGFSVVALSGELSQSERNNALQALRDGRAKVCVATDVAARGIDLPNLGLVIHAELPHDSEVLQHRSGRTGRAGRKGISVLLIPLSRTRKAEQLLAGAGIEPVWSGAPAADDIRRMDDERMLAEDILQQDASEEDAAATAALIAARSPEQIAAAFVRLYGAKLPAPEEVVDPGPGRERRTGPKPERDGTLDDRSRRAESFTGSTWFRLDIGRRNNAEARWLLPLICRRGNVTRQDIGAIRIFDRETKFEIAAGAAERFAKTIRRSSEEDIPIEKIAGEGKPARPRPDEGHTERPREPRSEKPRDARPPARTEHPRGRTGGAAAKPDHPARHRKADAAAPTRKPPKRPKDRR